MLDNIEVLIHSSIKFSKDIIIYFDPYKINKEYHDADIIFITHSHYDHYSPLDIKKVIKDNTIVVCPKDVKEELLKLNIKNIIEVVPNKDYEVLNIKFKTIPAYNVNKNFHPKENNWVGYLINYNNIKYYIAGDTDITEENKNIICDVAFVPVGGTFTMDYKEAASLINEIQPKIAVPTHYGLIVGNKDDGIKFSKLLNNSIECKIYIK